MCINQTDLLTCFTFSIHGRSTTHKHLPDGGRNAQWVRTIIIDFTQLPLTLLLLTTHQLHQPDNLPHPMPPIA